jgi:hypothetical protein
MVTKVGKGLPVAINSTETAFKKASRLTTSNRIQQLEQRRTAA